MQTRASKSRLWMGYWILAALLLFGYSGSKFLTLFTHSLPFRSREAKAASQNLDKLKEMAASPLKVPADNLSLDRMFGVFSEKSEDKAKPIPDQQKERGWGLPRLAGILRATTLENGVQYRAVMEGSSLREHDRVNGFTVKKIAPDGVTLAGSGGKWFIPAPQVDFSLDKGL